jgi:hypothetical protein
MLYLDRMPGLYGWILNPDPMPVSHAWILCLAGWRRPLSSRPSRPLSLHRGPNSIDWFCAADASAHGDDCPPLPDTLVSQGCAANGTDCTLLVSVATAAVEPGAARSLTVARRNVLMLAPPRDLTLPPSTIKHSVHHPSNTTQKATIVLEASAPAFAVVATTQAAGRFSDNAFMLLPADGPRVIEFIPFGELDLPKLESTLRVEHLQQNL